MAKQKFKSGKWEEEIEVRDFVQQNYTPYRGDDSFLAGPTNRTEKLWNECSELLWEEIENDGVLDVDTETVSDIDAYDAGYIDKSLEKVVGLQSDEPLKRTLNTYGGIRMARQAAEAYGYEVDEEIDEIFTKYRKTHNDGVYDAYTPELREIRRSGVITGLPDAYGRGRIIGDYRRIALYGIDRLIEDKKQDVTHLPTRMTEDHIRLREEVSEQIKALKKLKELGATYNLDLSRPAQNAQEAIQWTYMGYLASIQENNGAAMSFGRVAEFFDIYIEQDIKAGKLTEEEAQELIDDFVIKLRMARQLRTPAYNELFSGDPLWITIVVGGMGIDGRPLVSKTSFRILNTLYNLGPAPEPNLTVLWSENLPEGFKNFCTKVSKDTSSIQYENDDLMRENFGDDYSIACCVSAMKTGKEMQYFGARCNLPKTLLYSLNGGRDEKTGVQVGPEFAPYEKDVLEFEEVMNKFDMFLDWLVEKYVDALNIIHYMHDKYAYERVQMALHDTDVDRIMGFGVAGLSIIADSLSAIKYATVKPIKNDDGIIVDFEIEGDFPKYGNDDDRVDELAVDVVKRFMTKLKEHDLYRDAKHSMSILTITSNVVYGKKTGATPDGRKAGEPFAPGANPMHGRDNSGAIASLNSVAKLPYDYCQDGISNTFSIVPKALGADESKQVNNMTSILDGYFAQGAHHLNVNVFQRETLEDAVEHPEKYPQLTIRVSGYAVNFIRLTPEQQQEVIARTFHKNM
ncbi:formate acetyltransferase 1 [Halobacteroides halobius DSM 5150]|uniref:Formate acetyltransferase n=1 Tax=Halobacteroides halobius (strain ATCC 35273 / DSM 5150 / MD-1) TaxID=748449 RepID=L0KAZ3_HALHC|nr:formate C-acetyltransferase [Halobacteroides halobius]AGB42467.1 formate acetyltransferase 1 [Halobacteroides halobius DSM 5150]